MTPRRILIISRALPSARYPMWGVFELDQARALRDFGLHVSILSIDLRSFRWRRKIGVYQTKIDGLDVHTISIPLGRIPLPLKHAVGGFLLKRLLKRLVKKGSKPDLIHCHFSDMSDMTLKAMPEKRLPIIQTEHSSQILHELVPNRLLKLNRRIYPKLDGLIAVSPFLQKNIRKHWETESLVIPNIVDTNLFRFNPDKREKDRFVFCSVGNLNQRKGHRELLEAFVQADLGKKVELEIAGDGPLRNELQNFIDRKGLGNQVNLLGEKSRAEVAELLKKADAFVLASKSESFGVVYIEAMASGLPVIATKCGGPDFIDESCGFLVPVDDIDALAQAMKNMRERYSAFNTHKIHEYAVSKFSSKAVASELTKFYEKVIDRSK